MGRPRKEAITTDSRGDRDHIFETKPVELPVKSEPKMKLYISPNQKQGFKVPIKDENGKMIMATKPGTNMPVIINGRPVPMLRDLSFKTQSNNIKRGCLSYFEAEEGSDEDEVLQKLSDDPGTPIMTEETYLMKKDPEKFKLNKTIAEKDEAISNLSGELSASKDIIAELNEKIKKLSGE